MTRLTEMVLPVHLQCLRVPVEWTRVKENKEWCYAGEATTEKEEVSTYDPWEMRSEYLRLKRDDSEALYSFLKKVGLFDKADIEDAVWSPSSIGLFLDVNAEGGPYTVRNQPMRDERHFWELRLWLQDAMRDTDQLRQFDFQIRFWRKGKRQPVLLLTTVSFIEAVAASIWIDHVTGAKVRRCARKDCGVLFSDTSLRKKKFCCWYCGHIETVRRQRNRAKSELHTDSGKGSKR